MLSECPSVTSGCLKASKGFSHILTLLKLWLYTVQNMILCHGKGCEFREGAVRIEASVLPEGNGHSIRDIEGSYNDL